MCFSVTRTGCVCILKAIFQSYSKQTFGEIEFIWNKPVWFNVISLLPFCLRSASHKPVTGNCPVFLCAVKRRPFVYNVAMYYNAVVCVSLYNADRSSLSSHVFLLSIHPSVRLPVHPFPPLPLPSDNNNDNINITHGQFLLLHPNRESCALCCPCPCFIMSP
jgi:hypothetical protein